MTPDFSPGDRVRLARPDNPAHIRKGRVGVVREASVYQAPPPRLRYGREPMPAPPPRLWLWVDFPGCPHNGRGAFGTPVWGDEVTKERTR